MKTIRFVLLLLPFLGLAQTQPKLIVGIVVDQMRYEMLQRFQEHFGPDGFNRLVKDGMCFDSCTYNYIPTYTGPGHATIYTGKTPGIHGITSNDIYIPSEGKTRYCVTDETVLPVGTSESSAKRSPMNLRIPTLGDSLKLANPKRKVIALSVKDRGAILPGGKTANAAYWLDGQAHMVSSSYYMQALPHWVDSFNTYGYLQQNTITAWDYFAEPQAYTESLPDNAANESLLFDERNTLPYAIGDAMQKNGDGTIKYTPFANALITQFAIWALRAEKLGTDQHTDVLAISYSSTDYIGHAYGPQSVEVQDTYLRLDRDIAQLLSELDKTVGREHYILFLTSDHGAANTPTDPAFRYVSTQALKDDLNAFTQKTFGSALIAHIGAQQIWLNQPVLDSLDLQKEYVLAAIRAKMLAHTPDAFTMVLTQQELQTCNTPQCAFFTRSFIPELAGDLFYVRPYGHMERGENYGTTHGTSYLYDTHVPLLFFGGNVPAGRTTNPVYVEDIRRILRHYLPNGYN